MFIVLSFALLAFLFLIAFPRLPWMMAAWALLTSYMLSRFYAWNDMRTLICLFSLIIISHLGYYLLMRDKKLKASKDSSRSLQGSHIVLEKPIHMGKSSITLRHVNWIIHGPELPSGTLVTITAIVDGILIVEAHL